MSTACEITTTQQAQDCLRWYCLGSHCLRWRFEDWQQVLKSACRIDALQHKTAEQLQCAIAIHLVLAWQIRQMTLLGLGAQIFPPSACSRTWRLKCGRPTRNKTDRQADSAGRCRGHRSPTRRHHRPRQGRPPPTNQIIWPVYSERQFPCKGLSRRNRTSDSTRRSG